jgi:hypothetical protein
MELEEASWESTARSPNSFFKRASYSQKLGHQFRLKKGVALGSVWTRTRYVLGSCGMRFRMRVVFPLPRKPVMMVTGTGVILVAKRFGQWLECVDAL